MARNELKRMAADAQASIIEDMAAFCRFARVAENMCYRNWRYCELLAIFAQRPDAEYVQTADEWEAGFYGVPGRKSPKAIQVPGGDGLIRYAFEKKDVAQSLFSVNTAGIRELAPGDGIVKSAIQEEIAAECRERGVEPEYLFADYLRSNNAPDDQHWIQAANALWDAVLTACAAPDSGAAGKYFAAFSEHARLMSGKQLADSADLALMCAGAVLKGARHRLSIIPPEKTLEPVEVSGNTGYNALERKSEGDNDEYRKEYGGGERDPVRGEERHTVSRLPGGRGYEGGEAADQMGTDAAELSEGNTAGHVLVHVAGGDTLPALPGEAEGGGGDAGRPSGEIPEGRHGEASGGRNRQEFDNELTEKADAGDAPAFSDEEIDSVLLRGSFVDGGLRRIQKLYGAQPDAAERAALIGKEYGIGGTSWTFPDGSHGWVDCGEGGITIRRDNGPVARLSWKEAEKRIGELIRKGIYPYGEDNPPRADYRIEASLPAISGSQREKYEWNTGAIRLLKQLEGEGRRAAPGEQRILARYSGWGGMPNVFDESREPEKYRELRSLLDDAEFNAARSSTLSAFYTPPGIAGEMWKALESWGLPARANVLEPSCGTGNFLGMQPEGLDLSMHAVELDSLSGRIARQLYQKASVHIGSFEGYRADGSSFDAVIGNVPFGQYRVNDPRYSKWKMLVHDYFIARSLDLLRPGGIAALITSAGTMDKSDESARRYFAERADLIGAVRLPESAFQDAGTETVTDILFFQKRDMPPAVLPDWVHAKAVMKDRDVAWVSSYFESHPEMVLGNIGWKSSQYGPRLTVRPEDGRPLPEKLARALSALNASIPEAGAEKSGGPGKTETVPADLSVENFTYAVIDGEVYYRTDSVMERCAMPASMLSRISGMIGVRNACRRLLDYQASHEEDDETFRELMAGLNASYDSFADRFGRLTDAANRRAFRDDAYASLLIALEEVDEQGAFKEKSAIFSRRTVMAELHVTEADTPADALALSLRNRGKIDLPYMSALCHGMDEGELVRSLCGIGLIFIDPDSGNPVTSDEYLSGNVRKKLEAAKQAAEADGRFAANVAALGNVQPEWLGAADIEVRLGATWIPAEFIKAFAVETFKIDWWEKKTIVVSRNPVTYEWTVRRNGYSNTMTTGVYGTERANGLDLLENALNMRTTTVYDRIDGKSVANPRETAFAMAKQDEICGLFQDWVWSDPARRKILEKIYNETFNSSRPRTFSGASLKFPGMNPETRLRPHQLDAVARVLYSSGNTLLAHVVGAGKTYEMIASSQECRRMGICSKPLFVVPNHLTEQWGRDFAHLYPNARVLVAKQADFEKDRRRTFLNRIATGTWDAVIIGHSQFEKIPLSLEKQSAFIQEQIDSLAVVIDSSSDRSTVKQLEKMKKSLSARLEGLQGQISQRQDTGVVEFEKLGIDQLYVDEAHSFKNLFLTTKMTRIAGIPQSHAQKSQDMLMKCQYMREKGNKIVFATGTPVANSMTELYTMMRYLAMDTLKEMHLEQFDAWASTFGEVTTSIELKPEGTGYRTKRRFSRFFNLPELMSVFHDFADVVNAGDIRLPVPEAEYINAKIEPSEEQKHIVECLAERAEAIRNRRIGPNEDNMLCVTGDGRKAALDQRLYDRSLAEDPDGKLYRCAENIRRVWEDTAEDKGTQLVFCDISTPFKGFNAYDELKKVLVGQGIPEEEIAFIHQAKDDAQKDRLFDRVRKGMVRVLIGSTQKMGAGTNVQDRLAALHHLDCPWRPADLEQQEGRIIRQGNKFSRVKIFRYVTSGTFDAYLWQTIETKARFIAQLMGGKTAARSCEDVDESVLSYAEVKALATDNPLIREKMELDVQVEKLSVARRAYQREQFRLEELVNELPYRIRASKESLDGLAADFAMAKEALEPDRELSISIGGKEFGSRKDGGAALIEACRNVGSEKAVVGSFMGFSLSAKRNPFTDECTVYVSGRTEGNLELGRDPAGNIARIFNVLKNIENRKNAAEQRLKELETEMENARQMLGRPFRQEQEYQEKCGRLKAVNASLNVGKGSSRPEDDFGTARAARQQRPGRAR